MSIYTTASWFTRHRPSFQSSVQTFPETPKWPFFRATIMKIEEKNQVKVPGFQKKETNMIPLLPTKVR